MDATHSLRIVPHLDSSNALVFPIMEFTLTGSNILKIGRSIVENHSHRRQSTSQMTFRSKVVSRKHAEIFIEAGKVFLRDIQSSSGTFLNNRRLCAANHVSEPFQLHDNDIIQLGVDYQGGTQEIYRCVKMRLELNRNQQQTNNINKYNLKTYNTLRNLTTPPNHTTFCVKDLATSLGEEESAEDDIHVDECCICLFAIAPFQALFVAPCSHTFHYKCLRPLLANHPGFQCPLCRNYADLDASVSIEVDEVKTMLRTMDAPNHQSSQVEPIVTANNENNPATFRLVPQPGPTASIPSSSQIST